MVCYYNASFDTCLGPLFLLACLDGLSKRLADSSRVDCAVLHQDCYDECVGWKGHEAFLITFGDYCVCIDHEDTWRFLPGKTPGTCNAPCTGDHSRLCGGSNAYDVYVAQWDDELL